MNDTLMTIIGLLIPLAGTVLGAAAVFMFRGEMKPVVQKSFLGFASGVMLAAGVWSLILPALDMSGGWLMPSLGFVCGAAFLLLLDYIIPHLHLDSDKPEGVKSKLGKSTMLILAVTLHNIPEGMAVGVVYAGALSGSADVTLAGALALSIGIALQNIPEGAVISMPLIGAGKRKGRAFLAGSASGVVEPVGAVIALLVASAVTSVLPFVLTFAAGAMFYVVVEELIPEAQSGEHSNAGTVCAVVGFALMMILDVALG
ncbi:ZIP family metal transporter [Spirochaetia bacterium]|nr:ZIP family metal transporter [Spirochaetia bacterium]